MKIKNFPVRNLRRIEELSLADASHYLLEECRMVLPGIQALFGFQLIAVFNDRFVSDLTAAEQRCHLGAIALVAIAAALVMAPASYHRQREPRAVSDRFIRISSGLLLSSMVPLAMGISIDFYLTSVLILHSVGVSLVLAAILLGFLVMLWFGLPYFNDRDNKIDQDST